MLENVGNLAANFLLTPEVQSALQNPPLHCTLLVPIPQLRISRLVAHWHTSQSFEPSISLPNSYGTSVHNQAMDKQHFRQFLQEPLC